MPKYVAEEKAHETSRYCVRPNSGRIEPGHEVEVTGSSPTQSLSSISHVKYQADMRYLQSSSRP